MIDSQCIWIQTLLIYLECYKREQKPAVGAGRKAHWMTVQGLLSTMQRVTHGVSKCWCLPQTPNALYLKGRFSKQYRLRVQQLLFPPCCGAKNWSRARKSEPPGSLCLDAKPVSYSPRKRDEKSRRQTRGGHSSRSKPRSSTQRDHCSGKSRFLPRVLRNDSTNCPTSPVTQLFTPHGNGPLLLSVSMRFKGLKFIQHSIQHLSNAQETLFHLLQETKTK